MQEVVLLAKAGVARDPLWNQVPLPFSEDCSSPFLYPQHILVLASLPCASHLLLLHSLLPGGLPTPLLSSWPPASFHVGC